MEILENRITQLPVMESFYTIQGEGFYQGRAAYFIRLGGCDVGCIWCDVKESWDADKHPLVQIEKLVMEVNTDGTINPEEAVKQASRILIQHLMIITDENITFDTREDKKEDLVDEQTLQLRKTLKTPLEDLDLSVRAFNCLKAAKINSLSELVQYEQEDLMKFRNFGQKSLSEIEQVLNERGLGFGMDLSKIKIDED